MHLNSNTPHIGVVHFEHITWAGEDHSHGMSLLGNGGDGNEGIRSWPCWKDVWRGPGDEGKV